MNLNKVTYTVRDTVTKQVKIVNFDISEVIHKGMSFTESGTEYDIYASDQLIFLMHQHCPTWDYSIHRTHTLTMRELYFSDKQILFDLLELYGGAEFIYNNIREENEYWESRYHEQDPPNPFYYD